MPCRAQPAKLESAALMPPLGPWVEGGHFQPEWGLISFVSFTMTFTSLSLNPDKEALMGTSAVIRGLPSDSDEDIILA